MVQTIAKLLLGFYIIALNINNRKLQTYNKTVLNKKRITWLFIEPSRLMRSEWKQQYEKAVQEENMREEKDKGNKYFVGEDGC